MNYKYYTIDKKISFICNNEYNYFLNKANVVGLALGYKIQNGFNTFKKCISIFVVKKLMSTQLHQQDFVPQYYKGIPTDIIETNTFNCRSLTDRIRPIIGGYVIGSVQQDSGGTMGCLVTDGKYTYLLSNNHVLALENKSPKGTSIIQPSIASGGNINLDIIANLSKFITIKSKKTLYTPTNYVDCALAKVIDPSSVSCKIALVGKPKGTTSAVLGQPIKKVGCTTELTTGVVTNTNTTLIVNYSLGKCLFKEQILVNCMSDGGDSGSLVMDDNNYAIGLLMSSTINKNIAVINPIDCVLKALKVNIVT